VHFHIRNALARQRIELFAVHFRGVSLSLSRKPTGFCVITGVLPIYHPEFNLNGWNVGGAFKVLRTDSASKRTSLIVWIVRAQQPPKDLFSSRRSFAFKPHFYLRAFPDLAESPRINRFRNGPIITAIPRATLSPTHSAAGLGLESLPLYLCVLSRRRSAHSFPFHTPKNHSAIRPEAVLRF